MTNVKVSVYRRFQPDGIVKVFISNPLDKNKWHWLCSYSQLNKWSRALHYEEIKSFIQRYCDYIANLN